MKTKMKKKRNVQFILAITALLFLALIFQWSNVFNEYSIPSYPGLSRLGAGFLFPRANKVAWENEQTIIFTGSDFGGPGSPFYRYQIKHGWPRRLLPDFRIRDFKLSPVHRLITIIGWDFFVNNELWIFSGLDEPTPVEYSNNTLYDAISVDWSTDDESLIVYYHERPNINSFKKIQFSTQDITDLFFMEDGDYPSDDIDEFDDRVVYVTKNTNYSISILTLEEQTVEVLKFDDFAFSNVRFLQQEPWLIATAGSNGRTEIALVNPVEGCITFPFKDFSGIYQFDVYETADNIKLLLTDHYGLMYIFDMAKALRQPDITSIFSCGSK
jgi:hypothetical protein